MTDRQLLVLIVGMLFVLIALVVELSENHVTKEDAAVAFAFVGGMGLAIAFFKSGKK